MCINDFINVTLINGGVPDALWINDHHRTMLTAIQTSGFIHSDFPRACQTQLFTTEFGVVKESLGIVLGTTVLAVFTLV
jgi:hypothetical protein